MHDGRATVYSPTYGGSARGKFHRSALRFQAGKTRKVSGKCILLAPLMRCPSRPFIVSVLNHRSNIMDSAPVFKFTYLILGPTAMWVLSTVIANPTKSNVMTFGQVRI